MRVYLGYDTVTKQYLKSLASGGDSSSGSVTKPTTWGFTMTGNINMDDNEIVGLDDPNTDSSATNKKYVDDKVANVGGLTQAFADNRYLKKTDATTMYETQTSASNTYLSKTNAASTYAPIGASWTKAESDAKYATSASGGISATGFRMQGDINMGGHNITGLVDPTRDDMVASKGYTDGNFLDIAGGTMVGNINMSDNDITHLPNVPPTNNSAASKKYVDDEIRKVPSSGGASTCIDMRQNEVLNLPDVPSRDHSATSKKYVTDNFCDTSGDTITGDLNTGGNEITNLACALTTDNSPVTKKWVTDQFPKKSEVLNGFMLSGALDLNGNEIYGLPDSPTTDNSATSKKYVDGEVTKTTLSGGTMTGDIDMNGNDVPRFPDVP